MAEPTDPAEVTALKAYDDAYSKLVGFQENFLDADVEGVVDAWVLKHAFALEYCSNELGQCWNQFEGMPWGGNNIGRDLAQSPRRQYYRRLLSSTMNWSLMQCICFSFIHFCLTNSSSFYRDSLVSNSFLCLSQMCLFKDKPLHFKQVLKFCQVQFKHIKNL